MNIFIMLAGVPGCGKSTLISKILASGEHPIILSTDNFIEQKAMFFDTTYDAIFKDTIKEAEQNLANCLQAAIIHNRPIIWDQTNISVKTREKKLEKIPDTYHKIAVWFATPDEDEWKRRLAARPGKTIPMHICAMMAKDFVIPTKDEGFDEVMNGTDLTNILQSIITYQ